MVIMDRKDKLFRTVLGLGLLLGFVSCSPMDEDYWINNSLVSLNWASANPETGRRPGEVEELNVRYYSQTDDANKLTVKNIEGSSQGFQIPSGTYDIMVLQPSDFLTRDDDFKTITFECPTHYNQRGERVISNMADEMHYVGKKMGETLDIEKQQQTSVQMERILKKLNFVVIVEETADLTRPVTVDMSGMAFRKKLWNMKIGDLDEAVQVFNLNKQGRYLNKNLYLTAYHGSTYCLGTCGRNILYLTLYDADNRLVTVKYDITPYLIDWSTAEETVHIRLILSGQEASFIIDGWDEGNTSDVIFDYQQNSEV